MIWLTGGLFVALLVVAGGVASLLLMNQSQDTRQRAATANGTVIFSFNKATMTIQPNGTDTFQVLINTDGLDLTTFSYQVTYPAESGLTLVGQEKSPSMIGVNCNFFNKVESGQQTASASCVTDGLTGYSNTVATPIATITLKAGAQGSATPIKVQFDMSGGGDLILALDKSVTDIAAIPQGSLAVTVEGGAPATSTNANLSSLVVSQATLTPAFSGTTTNYSSSVANSVSSITVTPTVADTTATVKVNGTAVSSGTASSAQSLNVGSNTITTEVTAGDGTTKKSYIVVISRAAAEQAASSSNSSSTINLTSTQTCNPNEFKAKIEVKENNQAKANVITEFEFNKEKKNGTTNASGIAEVTFPLPAPGSYSLIAKPQGFADKTATVSITACTAQNTTSNNTATNTTTVQCNQTCNATKVCATGLSCVGGLCRNTRCQTDSTCTCASGANLASQSGTTTLPSSGSVDKTLALFLIGGLLMLGGGQILVARFSSK